VADAADPPSQYVPGDDASAPPHVWPPPATLAPVAASSTAAMPHPEPSAAHAACAPTQLDKLVWP
jgi:hypothetical protein